MRDAVESGLGILIGFVILSAMARMSPSLLLVFNVLSLVVIHFALNKGEIWGAVLGMVCGLIHDSFSIGVFGIMGISKTVTGYLAGYVARKINVQPWLRQGIFLLALLSLELAIWVLLASFIFEVVPYSGNGLLFLQPPVTALTGIAVYAGIRAVKARTDRNSETR